MLYDHNPELPPAEEVIPHRPPRLWVDCVTSMRDASVSGSWTPTEELYEGEPLEWRLAEELPVEALAQLGCYSILSEEQSIVLFKGIHHARFFRRVHRGETIGLYVKILDRSRREFTGYGVARVGGDIVCETAIIGTILPPSVAQRLLAGPIFSPEPDLGMPDNQESWTPAAKNFEGHFPGLPVLQGIQTLGKLIDLGRRRIADDNSEAGLLRVAGVTATRFTRAVRPGDTLDLSFEHTPNSRGEFTGTGIASVGGVLACQSTIKYQS